MQTVKDFHMSAAMLNENFDSVAIGTNIGYIGRWNASLLGKMEKLKFSKVFKSNMRLLALVHRINRVTSIHPIQ